MLAVALPAQDTITIPKSRLQELERKEAELKKLKQETDKLPSPQKSEKPSAKGDLAPPKPAHSTPAISTLPGLAEGETVEAIDLSNHYRADAAAAQLRYRKRTFKVKGEIASFEYIPFVRYYQVTLKTDNLHNVVVCQVVRPEKYTAVFETDHGWQLVGLLPDQTRVPLARIGDTAILEGRCSGGDASRVKFTRCELKSVTAPPP